MQDDSYKLPGNLLLRTKHRVMWDSNAGLARATQQLFQYSWIGVALPVILW